MNLFEFEADLYELFNLRVFNVYSETSRSMIHISTIQTHLTCTAYTLSQHQMANITTYVNAKMLPHVPDVPPIVFSIQTSIPYTCAHQTLCRTDVHPVIPSQK